MEPSSKWFPLSLTERAAWYRNFNSNIQQVGASLGLTPAEMATIAADSEMLQFLAGGTLAVKSYAKAFESFRRSMTEGDDGTVTPGFPADPALVPPVGCEIGIFERLDRFVARIRTSAGFTDETKGLLGIAPTRYKLVKRHLEDEAAPVISGQARTGNIVNIKFIRGTSNGIYVEVQIDNDDHWQAFGRFVKSPAELEIPQNESKLPRKVRVRARFLEGNTAVGDWSDVVTVRTDP